MWIQIKDKEIERELKVNIRRIVKDTLSYKWIKEVIQDEVEKAVGKKIDKVFNSNAKKEEDGG
jgi:hypothetical protein